MSENGDGRDEQHQVPEGVDAERGDPTGLGVGDDVAAFLERHGDGVHVKAVTWHDLRVDEGPLRADATPERRCP